jgi:hypothetical protein
MWKLSSDYLTTLFPRIPCLVEQMLAVVRKIQADLTCSIQTPCCGLLAMFSLTMGVLSVLMILILMPEIDNLITWWVGSRKGKTDE